MSIGGFTVAAQVVNFLILVWLLRRFLYGPIVRAMDQRQQRIAERLKEAQRKSDAAAAAAEAYRRQLEELNAERDRLLIEARHDADRLRTQLLDAVRAEVAAKKEEWRQMLARERDDFLADLRRRIQQEFLSLARQALADLANASLESQLVAVFLDKIAGLDEQSRKAFLAALPPESRRIRVRCRFDLNSPLRRQLTEVIQAHLADDAEISFESGANLTCGIELRADGCVLGWSIDGYLSALEQYVGVVFNQFRAGPTTSGAAQ